MRSLLNLSLITAAIVALVVIPVTSIVVYAFQTIGSVSSRETELSTTETYNGFCV